MRLSSTLFTRFTRMHNSYIELIIVQMRRFGSIDLSDHHASVRVIFCDIADTDNVAIFKNFAKKLFLDRVEYLDEQSFALYTSDRIDDPDEYTEEAIEAVQIERKPKTQRRFVVCKDNDMTPPYIPMLDLHMTMRLIERSVLLLDGKCKVTEMKPYMEDDEEQVKFLADVISILGKPKREEKQAIRIFTENQQFL